ncbi:hypothetical protein RJ640_003798 [Escallonia rubra]|uniref:Fe2OG dioxygenase domain-containing protein n=1 Tax=Escallonia rubra TaxID=112253 RepID=A0AA88SHE8_9ASTE|nr:hypothetical protein RJ640_003798 [Escallonia rubra]
MAIPSIPMVDFSCFFRKDDGNGIGKQKIIDEVGKACSEYGFFQVVNHGVPLDLMNRALELSETFFELSMEEKLKCSPISTLNPAGYGRMGSYIGNNERLRMCAPGSSCNVFPCSPTGYRKTMEEIFKEFEKVSELVESIINEFLGLPTGFLGQYNNERTRDTMIAWHYPPATDITSNGRDEHQDSNCITFVLQDDVVGLEVKKDKQWIPIPPVKGSLVVNIGVILQVLSNKRFEAARHRVVKHRGRSRNSIVFFNLLGTDKWVEPLPQLTREIGEAPKYRGFVYKEFIEVRGKAAAVNPPSREDLTGVDVYEISTKED